MPGSVAVMLANYEQWRLDDEAEVAVLEWTSVALAHEEPDQPRVALAHFVGGLVERDASAVHDREIRSQRSVEGNEAVVQHGDRRVRYHFRHDRHGSESSRGAGRHLGLV